MGKGEEDPFIFYFLFGLFNGQALKKKYIYI